MIPSPFSSPIFVPAAANPVDHVLPHALHDEELFGFDVAAKGTDIPFLNIYDGHYGFFITNHMMMTAVSAIIVILVFWLVSRKIRIAGDGLEAYQTQGRVAQLFETICAFIRDEVARPNLHGLTDKYIPYIWTIFFFILFCNVLGLVPVGAIMQLITGDRHYSHWGGTATSNLALNSMLAILSFLAVIGIGIREAGAKAFFSHFNPVGWEPKMLPIGLGLFVLEWMGLVIKCVVLAMRLFGTMMAGHLVIAAFILLIFAAAKASTGVGYTVGIGVLLLGTALTLLELFICFLQAFIFTFLTVLFIASGAVHHHDPIHEEEDIDPLSDEAQMDIDKVVQPGRLGPAV
ncbi:MAG: F0F1 ATP synthase subunit A [Pirellulaceae bacterium]